MEFPPLTFPHSLTSLVIKSRIFYAAQCSGLHVFQFSSDYSPLHEVDKKRTTKKKENKKQPIDTCS